MSLKLKTLLQILSESDRRAKNHHPQSESEINTRSPEKVWMRQTPKEKDQTQHRSFALKQLTAGMEMENQNQEGNKTCTQTEAKQSPHSKKQLLLQMIYKSFSESIFSKA